MIAAARLVAGCLRRDRRRPASWIAALLAAGGTTAGLAADRPVAAPLLLLTAVAATVAAVGDPPRGLLPGPPRRIWPWLLSRSVWPVAGILAAVCIPRPAGPPWWDATAAVVAVAATLVTFAVAHARAAAPADAASLGLALGLAAAAAATATLVVAPASPAGRELAIAAAAWAVVAAAAFVWSFEQAATPPARLVLGGLEMATALAGMVAWLVLAPEHAWLDVWLVAAWCIVLPLPQATLAAGAAGAAGRAGLLRAAATRPAAAWRGVAIHAAILGWPAVVALAIGGTRADARSAAAAAVAAVVTVALTALALGLVAARPGRCPETAQACALAAAVALSGAALPRFRPQIDVERSVGTCDTPQPVQIAIRRLAAPSVTAGTVGKVEIFARVAR